MADSLASLATYVSQDAAVFPALLGFSIGARSSLKSWLAVQEAPAAPRISKEQEKSLKRQMLAVTMVVLFSTVGLELYLFSQGDEKTIDRFFTYLFGYIFQATLLGVFFDMTKAFKWSVHRGVAGVLSFRPAAGTVSYPKVVAAVLLSTAINLSAYYNLHSVFGGVLVTSVLVSKLGQTPGRSFSLRYCLFALIGFMALITTLMGLAIAAAIKLDRDAKTVTGDDGAVLEFQEGDAPPQFSFASPHVMMYVGHFIKAMYAFLPGFFIAGCLRFDYANALESSPDIVDRPTLEEVPAPASRYAFLSSGIILPSTVSTSFAKPYYHLALWSWIIAQLAAFGMLALVLPIPQEVLESGFFSLVGVYFSTIVMTLSMVVMATIKGDFKKMWTYREEWVPTKSDQGVVLEDSVDDLPAYDDNEIERVDVKEPLLNSVNEEAPAYEVLDHKV